MRILVNLLLNLFILSTFAQNVKVATKTIVPINWADLPIVYSNDIKGGIHELDHPQDTVRISTKRKQEGMFVYAKSSAEFFQLRNNKWHKVLLNIFVKEKPLVADTGTFYFNRDKKQYEFYDGQKWVDLASNSSSESSNMDFSLKLTETQSKGFFTSYTNSLPTYSPVYYTSSGTYALADNTDAMKNRCVGIINSDTSILNYGLIYNPAWNFSQGDILYLGSGAITSIKPTTVNQYVQVIGYALASKLVFVNPTLSITRNTANVSINPKEAQILTISAQGTNLTVTESPVANSRAWFYSTNPEGPYDQSLNNTTLSYIPKFSDFGTTGNKYIVCRSSFDGGISESAPVKIFYGVNEISSSAPQIIPVGSDGTTLTVSTSPPATSVEWCSSSVQGGPYVTSIGVGTSYIPNFSEEGTYYIVCKSTIDGNQIISNEVIVSVSDNQIYPIDEQFIKVGNPINAITNSSSDPSDWYYGTNANGPFDQLIASNQISLSTSSLAVGTYYIVSKSSGSTSNVVKVNVITDEILPVGDVFIKSGNPTNMISFPVSPPASLIKWYYGSTVTAINNELGVGESLYPSFANDGNYYIKARADYPTVSIESKPKYVQVVSLNLASKSTIVAYKDIKSSKAIEITYITDEKVVSWNYGIGDGQFNFPFPNPINNKKLYPQLSTTGIYYAIAKATYGVNEVQSDSVKLIVIDPKIIPPINQIIKVNSDGSALNFEGIFEQTNIIWQYQLDGGAWQNITGQNGKSYTPNFVTPGQYKIRAQAQINSTWFESNHIYITVVDYNLQNSQNQQIKKGDYNTDLKTYFNPSEILQANTWKYGTDLSSLSSTSTVSFREKFDQVGKYYVFGLTNLSSVNLYTDTLEIDVVELSIDGNRERVVGVGSSLTFTATENPVGTNQTWDILLPNNSKLTDVNVNPYSFSSSGIYRVIYNTTLSGKDYADTVKVTATSLVIEPSTAQVIPFGSAISPINVQGVSSGTYSWSYATQTNSNSPTTITGSSSYQLSSWISPVSGSVYIRTSQGLDKSNEVEVKVIDNVIKTASGNNDIYVKAFDSKAEKISVQVEQSGLDSLRWYYGTDPSNINTRLTSIDANNSEYSPVFGKGIYYVQCRSYYGGVEIPSSNYITVNSIDIQISGVDNQVLSENSEGSALTISSLDAVPTTYNWYYKNPQINNGQEVNVGVNNANFRPSLPQKSFEFYEVYCKILYPDGTVLTSATKKVAVPIISISPVEYQRGTPEFIGSQLTATVLPSGINPTIEWYYNYTSDPTDEAYNPITFPGSPTVTISGLNYTPTIPAWDEYRYIQAKIIPTNSAWPNILSNKVGIGKVLLVKVDGAWIYTDGHAPTSAQEYLTPTNADYIPSDKGDDLYWVDLDGDGGNPAIKVYCSMNLNGGAWMLAFAGRTASNSGPYSSVDPIWKTEGGTSDLTSYNQNGKTPIYDRFQASKIMLSHYEGGYSSYISANLFGGKRTLLSIVSQYYPASQIFPYGGMYTFNQGVTRVGNYFKNNYIKLCQGDNSQVGDGAIWATTGDLNDYNTREGNIGTEFKYARDFSDTYCQIWVK